VRKADFPMTQTTLQPLVMPFISVRLWMQFEGKGGEFCRQCDIQMPFVPRMGDVIWADDEHGDTELAVDRVEFWQKQGLTVVFVVPQFIEGTCGPCPDSIYDELCERFSSWDA